MFDSVVDLDELRDSPRPNAMRGLLSVVFFGVVSSLLEERPKLGRMEKRRDDRLDV